MSFKKNKLILYIHQFIILMIIFSILFAIYFLFNNNGNLLNYLYEPIFISNNHHYQLYLVHTIGYIILLTIFATSYLGIPFTCLLITYRILAIIYSLAKIGTIQLNLYLIFVIIIPQIILELLITYVTSFYSIRFSLQTFLLNFVFQENYRFKELINYFLNDYIMSILLVFISIVIKIYLI
ncbi:hypothetical protein DW911_00710 [Erysipelatoclostridium sp. AM42-17]|nr:hypothetical protein DWZ53_00710 [Coprobacillus sp. AF33-1AC]RHS96375.1 hypothetical protein DW911_00710 [Erysipelatoclostridium sp. AM42-17]